MNTLLALDTGGKTKKLSLHIDFLPNATREIWRTGLGHGNLTEK
jgi:hypothetical protein